MALQEKILALEQRISVLVEALEGHRRDLTKPIGKCKNKCLG